MCANFSPGCTSLTQKLSEPAICRSPCRPDTVNVRWEPTKAPNDDLFGVMSPDAWAAADMMPNTAEPHAMPRNRQNENPTWVYHARNLPPPRMEEWAWQQEGSCRDVPVSVFFPEGMRGQNLRSIEEKAKLICHGCPVMTRCRRHAMETPEFYGIWGATIPRERAGRHAISRVGASSG
jgi:WhiB family redox-sensing transcriptional regulator